MSNSEAMGRPRIGLFPFGAESNPYQLMIAEALAAAGCDAVKLPKRNWLPLRWATEQPIDVLQMYWPHSLYHAGSPLRAWVKRLMLRDGLRMLERKPFVYSVENLFPHDAADEAFEKRMIQSIVEKADGHIVMSEASASIFRQTYQIKPGAECYHVPHQNYLGIYPNTLSKPEARRRLNLPPTAPVILFLGRLLWYKGLDELIPAFLGLNAPGAILLLAGRPVDQAMLQQLRQHSREHARPGSGEVRFDARFIPDSEIQVYMNAADVVALPYADMPMNPGSLIMAMGFAKPIISPAKGATPEIAGETCLFGFSPDQPKALAETLARALNDSSLEARGQEAAERVRINHSKERVAAAFARAYARLASRLGRRFS